MAATPWRSVGAASADSATATTTDALNRKVNSKWRIGIRFVGLRNRSGNILLTNPSVAAEIFCIVTDRLSPNRLHFNWQNASIWHRGPERALTISRCLLGS